MNVHRILLLGIAVPLGLAGCQNDRDEGRSGPTLSNEAQAQPAQPQPEAPSMRELDEGPPEHVTYRPTEIEWRDGPESFEVGAQYAVLEGDPSKPGVFTMRIKAPDGFVVNPHWHPNVERVTVLRGTLHLGSGETVDKEAAEALTAGTYTSMPPEMVHYAITEGETMIQLTTVGPWDINYVDSKDDPRERGPAGSTGNDTGAR